MSTLLITGYKELNKALEQLPDRIAKNVLRGMVSAGAEVVRKEAKANVLVGKIAHAVTRGKNQPKVQPGFLKKGIRKARRKVRVRGTETYAVGVWQPKGQRMWPYYWRFVELEMGKSTETGKPFLRPALDTKKTEVIERMREYGAVRVEKEAEKLRK